MSCNSTLSCWRAGVTTAWMAEGRIASGTVIESTAGAIAEEIKIK